MPVQQQDLIMSDGIPFHWKAWRVLFNEQDVFDQAVPDSPTPSEQDVQKFSVRPPVI